MTIVDHSSPALCACPTVSPRDVLGDDTPDALVIPGLVHTPPVKGPLTDQLARVLGRAAPLAYLRQRSDLGASGVAKAAFSAIGLETMVFDVAILVEEHDPFLVVEACAREARLRGAGLVIEGIDALEPWAIRRLSAEVWPTTLIGSAPWDPKWSARTALSLDVTTDDVRAANEPWRAVLEGLNVDVGPLVEFRLGPRQIEQAVSAAHAYAIAFDRPLGVEDLAAGARSQNSAGLEKLARRIRPAAGWSDMVLRHETSSQLDHLASRVAHRTQVLDGWGFRRGGSRGEGITALFAGESGTGKTMAAEVIAGDLGLDLYVIDLATVVDKYIGETEKNLDRIFSEAEGVNGVLFFDEADALFGNRSEVNDARDRYANVEVAYLLQRMETFDGLAVLASNLRANIDEAFMRRISVTIDFPSPDDAERRKLWDVCLGAVPRADDLDLDFCAGRVRALGWQHPQHRRRRRLPRRVRRTACDHGPSDPRHRHRVPQARTPLRGSRVRRLVRGGRCRRVRRAGAGDRDSQPERKRRRRPSAPASAHDGVRQLRFSPGTVAALQRGGGNRAVARQLAVQRDDPTFVDIAETTHSATEIKDMTLTEFDDYADTQADWATQLTEPEADELRPVLEFARIDLGGGSVLAQCGGMHVKDILGLGTWSDIRAKLLDYAEAASQTRTTVDLPATTDPEEAGEWADALTKLEGAIPGDVLNATMKQETPGPADRETRQLTYLIDHSYVEDLVRYTSLHQPFYEATNGWDFVSYFEQRGDDGVDPVDYVTTAGQTVRNLHRFESDLLDAIVANRALGGTGLPLAVILHTSRDHNGAFHRDSALTRLVERPGFLTIMVEGAESIDTLVTQLDDLADAFGVAGRVREVMLAGHGSPRGMDLAGNPYMESTMWETELNLDTNPEYTERFFDSLMARMDDDPNARIVLNACLTASTGVDPGLVTEGETAAVQEAEINAAVAANGSLTAYVQQRWDQEAADRGITAGRAVGAVGSFPGGPELMDAGGRMDIVWGADPVTGDPGDPALTSNDPFEYLAEGRDPGGVMNALVQCWASDRTRAATTVDTRIGAMSTSIFAHRVVKSLLEAARANWGDAHLIAELAHAAEYVSMADDSDECELAEDGWAIAPELRRNVPAWARGKLFGDIHGHIPGRCKLAVYQGWGDAARFMGELDHHACEDAVKYVDIHNLSTYGFSVSGLLGVGTDAAKLRLAILATEELNSADAVTHLQGVYDAAGDFASVAGFDTAASGYTDADTLQASIGRAPGVAAPSGSSAPDPTDNNVDLDNDGTNDFWVEPLTRRSVVTASRLRLRQMPTTASSTLDVIDRGTEIDIIGSRGRWYCVEVGSSVGFMYARYLDVQPTH